MRRGAVAILLVLATVSANPTPDDISAPGMALVRLFINTTCSAQVGSHNASLFVYENIVLANRVEASVRAFAQVLIFGLLAHSGGIPSPTGRLGKAFFGGFVFCTLVQSLYTTMSIVSYVAAWASFSSAHASCLVPWLHGRAYFDMVAFGTLGFHPQLLAHACVLVLYVLLLVEARRVWCCVYFNRDIGDYWARDFSSTAAAGTLVYTIISFLVFLGSVSVLFSLAFVGVALASGAMLYAAGWLMVKLRAQTAGEGRWPPVQALHEATSFFAAMGGVFGQAKKPKEECPAKYEDYGTGGLTSMPILITLFFLFLSPLVAWGTPLTLSVYAGRGVAANNALLADAYAAAFHGFAAFDFFALPLLELDASRLQQALADTLRWPDLSWGAQQLMWNARAMLTLNGFVGVIKSLLSAVAAALASDALGACEEVVGLAHNVPTSMVAGDHNWKGVTAVQEICRGDAKAKAKAQAQQAKAGKLQRKVEAPAEAKAAAAAAAAAVPGGECELGMGMGMGMAVAVRNPAARETSSV
jgi:hypothetical protein